MNKYGKQKILFFVFFLLFGRQAEAQFYNGHQMTFGKNRVQYTGRYWKYHRYDRFDTYYHGQGDTLSRMVAEIVRSKLPEMEKFFGYGLQKRLIFICYKNLSAFRESNIGYDSNDAGANNVGGVTRITGNKVFVYFEDGLLSLEKQIATGIAELQINELLYGGSYTSKFTNSTFIELPDWYDKGLSSYLGRGWNLQTENMVRDGFMSGKYKNINYLTEDNARYAGESFWHFIASTYGKEAIPNILYMTRVYKSAERGFKAVLGLGTKQLSVLWKDFYTERFQANEEDLSYPKKKMELWRIKKDRRLNQIKYNPQKKLLAFVENEHGKYRIKIFNPSTKKTKTIFKAGHHLEQIPDYSYPVLAWHPSGNILTFFIEKQGRLKMYNYKLSNKKMSSRNVLFFDKILSASYSDNGYMLALSGVIQSQTDIFIYHVSAANYQRVTNDKAGDFNPVFADHSTKIIYASDAYNTSYPHASGYVPKDLYVYDLKTKATKNLTQTPYFDEDYPVVAAPDNYLTTTDKTGIYNLQSIHCDSTISYVDTSVHYRYTNRKRMITNSKRNIEKYAPVPSGSPFAGIYFDRRYRIYDLPEDAPQKNFSATKYRQELTEILQKEAQQKEKMKRDELRQKQRADSLKESHPEKIAHPDSLPVDINNYVFETDKQLAYYYLHPIAPDSTNSDSLEDKPVLSTYNYLTNFYTNYLVQQVDLVFLNSSYQAFTGTAYYFNPGLNVFIKTGIYDLFEDYRISGGFRLGTSLTLPSYEYYLSLENLKKRFDKRYVYHRRTYSNIYRLTDVDYSFFGKHYLNEGMFILKYPFSQVSSVQGTLTLRHDRGVYLSSDHITLDAPDFHSFFAGAKLEYNFDNVSNLGLNLWNGIRFKVFTEFYQEIDQGYTNLFVTGLDFRYYKKIHRNLIFASRVAASASFGKSKLLYYLGGVDNWTVFNPQKQMFDNSVRINEKENYVYQAVATNMRGFIQNVRNGTNFVVINNEIRFPVIRYLLNRPISSSLLNNLQVVGFFDMGSAWSGISPEDDANAYRSEEFKKGAVTVWVDKNRWPVVFGYGFGIRTRLLGYFVRLDWAWGIDNNVILPRVFYLSLTMDF